MVKCSAPTIKAKSKESVGWTDFSGKAVSRMQQHLTLGLPREFSELQRPSWAVSWQPDAFITGAESARSCCTKPAQDPGGKAKPKLMATASSW
jgi:hypothetical protein